MNLGVKPGGLGSGGSGRGYGVRPRVFVSHCVPRAYDFSFL